MKSSALSRRSSLAPRALPKVSPRDHVDSMILKLEEELYPSSEWVMLREVRSETGLPEVVRYADALAVRLIGDRWEIHGFEIKRTRSDWIAELRDPLKCAPLKLFCSAWWLVTAAPSNRIVLPHELPDLWGHTEIGTGSPNVIRWPVERRAESPESHPGFLKSLFRSMARHAAREDAGAVGAPSVRINRIIDKRHVGLLCGHTALAPMSKANVYPLALPCFGCAEGRPTDHEYLEAAALDETREDHARIRTLLLGRGADETGGAA